MDRLQGAAPFRVDPPAWVDLRGTLPGNEQWDRRTLEEAIYLVIHHSGVNVDSTARSIAEYHVNVKGWTEGIGYHWLVHWDGRIEYVGDMLTARANVAKRNREVIGICLPGNWSDDVPSDAQLGGVLELVTWLRALLPWAEVRGHGEIALPAYPSQCPGLTWPAWRAILT